MLRPPMPVHPYQEGGYGGPSTEAAAMVLQFMAAAAESGPPANVQPHSSQPPAAVRWVEHVPQVAELPSHFDLRSGCVLASLGNASSGSGGLTSSDAGPAASSIILVAGDGPDNRRASQHGAVQGV